MIIVGFVVSFIIIFSLITADLEKLVCELEEASITIMYDENGITGYTTIGIAYDLEGQK